MASGLAMLCFAGKSVTSRLAWLVCLLFWAQSTKGELLNGAWSLLDLAEGTRYRYRIDRLGMPSADGLRHTVSGSHSSTSRGRGSSIRRASVAPTRRSSIWPKALKRRLPAVTEGSKRHVRSRSAARRVLRERPGGLAAREPLNRSRFGERTGGR